MELARDHNWAGIHADVHEWLPHANHLSISQILLINIYLTEYIVTDELTRRIHFERIFKVTLVPRY